MKGSLLNDDPFPRERFIRSTNWSEEMLVLLGMTLTFACMIYSENRDEIERADFPFHLVLWKLTVDEGRFRLTDARGPAFRRSQIAENQTYQNKLQVTPRNNRVAGAQTGKSMHSGLRHSTVLEATNFQLESVEGLE